MRLVVRDDTGRAQLMLVDGVRILGTAMLTWEEYRSSAKAVVSAVMELTASSLAERLGAALWRDTVASCHGDAVIARERLENLGWSQEKVARLASELAAGVAHDMAAMLPQHR